MKINNNDWILYEIDPNSGSRHSESRIIIKFEKFENIPKLSKPRILKLASRYVYAGMTDYNTKLGNLTLLLICDERGEKYADKYKIVFKPSNSPYKGIRHYIDNPYRKSNDNVYMKLYGALNYPLVPNDSITMRMYEKLNHPLLPDGTKKSIALNVLNYLIRDTKSLNEIFEDVDILYNETKEKIKQIKQYMETPNKYLVELSKYNEETKKVELNHDIIFIYNADKRAGLETEKKVNDLILRSFVDPNNKKDIVQDILTIKNNKYKIASGNFKFTGDKWANYTNKSQKDPLVDINWEESKILHTTCIIDNKEEKRDFHVYGNAKKTLKYLQVKYPKLKYSTNDFISKPKTEKPGPKQKKEIKSELDKKETKPIKKELSERSKYLNSLPKIGESAPVSTRKVCCMEKKTGRIFRGLKTRVDKLVDSGAYEYCQKKYWKQTIYKWNEKHKKVIIKTPAKYNKEKKEYFLPQSTNIIKSPSGKKLGERYQKKELNKERQNAKANYQRGGRILKIREQKTPDGKIIYHHDMMSKHKMSEADRTQQIAKDLKKYEESLGKPKSNNKIRKNKNLKRRLEHKSWEAILTIENHDTILKKVYVKAMTEKEALDKLNNIIINYGKKDEKGNVTIKNYSQYDIVCGKVIGKLTGKTKPWVRQIKNNK